MSSSATLLREIDTELAGCLGVRRRPALDLKGTLRTGLTPDS
jgi:hypothetical protein